MLYRILTESSVQKDLEAIQATAIHFQGFTVLHGMGFWNGQSEHSLIIEIQASIDDARKVADVVYRIRRQNQQEAVLVQRLLNKADLVYADHSVELPE